MRVLSALISMILALFGCASADPSLVLFSEQPADWAEVRSKSSDLKRSVVCDNVQFVLSSEPDAVLAPDSSQDTEFGFAEEWIFRPVGDAAVEVIATCESKNAPPLKVTYAFKRTAHCRIEVDKRQKPSSPLYSTAKCVAE